MNHPLMAPSIPAPIRSRESQGRAEGVARARASPPELEETAKLIPEPPSRHASSLSVKNLAVAKICVRPELSPLHGFAS